MIYENNWLTTNVLDFKNNRNIKEVRCEFVPGDFEESSFIDAATKVANTLKNKYEHIFVAYSGGSDSTFIVNTLHSVGANFTPIAIEAEHTTEELQRAYSNCKRLGLDLVVLDFMGEEKEQSLKRLFNHYILDRCNYSGMVAVSIFFFLIIHDYIKQIHSDAILITGDTPFTKYGNVWYHSWELCPSLWEKESASMIPFLMYNQHILYEMASHMNKLNCPPYWDRPTPYIKYDLDCFGLPIVDHINTTKILGSEIPSYRDLRCDMYEIPRAKKIRGYSKMSDEWKSYHMNTATWVNADKPPKFREKDSDSNYRTYAQIWRSLKDKNGGTRYDI